MMKLKIIWSIIIIILMVGNNLYSQELIRHVVGSGGMTVGSDNIKIRCTIGQTHIALLKSTNENITHGVGYWYAAEYLMNHPNPVTVIIIPNLSAEIGKHVTVPLILQEIKNNDLLMSRDFIAKIRYNMTVLQPIGYTPECSVQNGDECTITVNGTFNESSGILKNIDFLVRLGSVENSPLIIESFEWKDQKDVVVLKQDGDLEILGICREGDTIRTVRKTVEAGLMASYPEPASEQTLINYNLSEKGITKISLTNNIGREILTIYNGMAEPGRHSTLVDLTDISSGMYYINLITPTERFSRKLLIQK